MKDPIRNRECSRFWNRLDPKLEYMLLYYDAEMLDRQERPEILSYLPPLEGMDTLDLGAGIGRFTGEFAKKCRSVEALDFAPLLLKENEKKNRRFTNIRYQCKDALDADFEPASFDLVFISWLFMYLTDAETETLAMNILRWLKPGGYLFFRESCAPKTFFWNKDGYLARYRSFLDYSQLFQNRLTLIREGNILAYEQHKSDCFKGFWLYQKTLNLSQ